MLRHHPVLFSLSMHYAQQAGFLAEGVPSRDVSFVKGLNRAMLYLFCDPTTAWKGLPRKFGSMSFPSELAETESTS